MDILYFIRSIKSRIIFQECAENHRALKRGANIGERFRVCGSSLKFALLGLCDSLNGTCRPRVNETRFVSLQAPCSEPRGIVPGKAYGYLGVAREPRRRLRGRRSLNGSIIPVTMNISKRTGRLAGLHLLFFLASCIPAFAGSAPPSKTERIAKQLQILEESQSNLRPEQRSAIQNIREILEEKKIATAYAPPYHFEACKREMIDNEDGTFTFIIETDKEIQRWMLPVNSNEFNQGMSWHAARIKVKEYDLNGIKGWRLPSIEVLYGIHRVNSDCPGKLRKVTSAPIVKGQFYHFAYWTSNEYSFIDSPKKLHADTVSLYTGNVIHERKENIGILWPAKLLGVEPVAPIQNELLKP